MITRLIQVTTEKNKHSSNFLNTKRICFSVKKSKRVSLIGWRITVTLIIKDKKMDLDYMAITRHLRKNISCSIQNLHEFYIWLTSKGLNNPKLAFYAQMLLSMPLLSTISQFWCYQDQLSPDALHESSCVCHWEPERLEEGAWKEKRETFLDTCWTRPSLLYIRFR